MERLTHLLNAEAVWFTTLLTMLTLVAIDQIVIRVIPACRVRDEDGEFTFSAEGGNEYKQLPQPKSLPQLCKEYETIALDLSKPQQNVQTYSPVEMIEQILGMDTPARTRLVLLGRILECNPELARAYAKQFDQLQTEYAVQQTTQKEGFDK